MVSGRFSGFLNSRLLWGAAAFLLIVAASVGGWWADHFFHAPFPADPESPRFFKVPEGQSGSAIAERLEEAGLIRSALGLKLLLRWQGPQYRLQAGEYRFDEPLSLVQVAEKLHHGRIHHYKVTIPEGLDRRETAGIWASRGFGERSELLQQFQSPDLIADLDPEARNLEGYLAPDTYLVPGGESPPAIARHMVRTFRSRWTEAGRRRARKLGFSLREIVTLASLVEKETSLAGERRLVAAVFHNRLRRNMKLECDPTVVFAVKEIKPFDGIIHRSDLQLDSPYNTYLHSGLPPGPICSPGAASLEAALDPAPVDYLFFVSRNDGSHVFSENYRDHRKAVLEFQR